jgi:hypothetical protein
MTTVLCLVIVKCLIIASVENGDCFGVSVDRVMIFIGHGAHSHEGN